MNEEPDAPQYQRSSFCAGGSCVEVAALDSGHVALRDGKAREQPPHIFTADEWDAFLAGANGEFDRTMLI